jgi:hypothetical protein
MAGDRIRSNSFGFLVFRCVGFSMAEQRRIAGGCGDHRGAYKYTATRSIHEVRLIFRFLFCIRLADFVLTLLA